MTTTCASCSTAPAATSSPTGRPLCAACSAQLTGLAGAGATIAAGGTPAQAVGTGVAASGYAGSLDVEAAHRASQRARLAQARGFWARLRIRVIG